VKRSQACAGELAGHEHRVNWARELTIWHRQPVEGVWPVLKCGVLSNLAAASFAHLVQVIGTA
jgi:hypothetical protein